MKASLLIEASLFYIALTSWFIARVVSLARDGLFIYDNIKETFREYFLLYSRLTTTQILFYSEVTSFDSFRASR